MLCLVYKSLRDSAPDNLKELLVPYQPGRNLRSTNTLLLRTNKCRVKYGERAFSNAGPYLWNALPLDIRASQNIFALKKKLKTYLF